VIVAGARTPFGKFGGAFKDLPATSLGASAIRAAIERSGIAGSDVDYVIMGQVLQAGAGQITARQAAIEAGIPQEVPAMTINKVCLSGLNAIALADQLIRAGEVEVVVAGGMESMSEAPYLVPKARFGARMGNSEMIDSMIHDGLWSTFTGQHMGTSSDDVNRELELSREEQDAWAARSHQRAEQAWTRGDMEAEVAAVTIPQKHGHALTVTGKTLEQEAKESKETPGQTVVRPLSDPMKATGGLVILKGSLNFFFPRRLTSLLKLSNAKFYKTVFKFRKLGMLHHKCCHPGFPFHRLAQNH